MFFVATVCVCVSFCTMLCCVCNVVFVRGVLIGFAFYSPSESVSQINKNQIKSNHVYISYRFTN